MIDTKAGFERKIRRMDSEIVTLLLSRLSARAEKYWAKNKDNMMQELIDRKTNPYAVVEELITNI
jgi:hypothetical protein